MAEASNPNSKPTVNSYRNLGGINIKASEYSLDKAQFLDLRNLDFDVPNALSKRPGSTQAIGTNTSGPVISLFEYQRIDGLSAVIAGTDTAIFYLGNNGLTLLDTGWSNGQPPDMLTFVNRLWMANGQNFKNWSGPGLTPLSAGMPCPKQLLQSRSQTFNGATMFTVGGSTQHITGDSYITRGVFVAYSYLRNDGFWGPVDLQSQARNVVVGGPVTNGQDFFAVDPGYNTLGFTVPSGLGISAVAVWIAVDTVGIGASNMGGTMTIPGLGVRAYGVNNLSFQDFTGSIFYTAYTLKPNADVSRFRLYTLMAPGTFIPLSSGSGVTMFGATLFDSANAFNFNPYTSPNPPGANFTGTQFCFFDTYIPKYIEVNQNSMFSSGFSAAPSVMWFSELGMPETVEPENSIEVRTNDGDRIYGMRAFNNQIIVMKQYSFHKVVGDSPENYELVELSLEYGCISDKTICEYREKLVWLDQKGILEYNGVSWDIISSPVEDIFRRMNLSAAKEKAVGVHHLYRNQIWWGIPIDGATQNNITVVYDYLVGAWTFFDGFNPASFALVQANLTKPTVWRGNYSGMIFYHGESFFGDNGQGISCVMRPSWDHLKENETWIWRRFFLDVNTASGLTGTISGKLYRNYDFSTVQATFSMFQDAFQSRAEFGVPGKAVTGDFSHHSASLPLLINGYSWARRFLRNV